MRELQERVAELEQNEKTLQAEREKTASALSAAETQAQAVVALEAERDSLIQQINLLGSGAGNTDVSSDVRDSFLRLAPGVLDPDVLHRAFDHCFDQVLSCA